jgi:iron complex outermembrane receptor protein
MGDVRFDFIRISRTAVMVGAAYSVLAGVAVHAQGVEDAGNDKDVSKTANDGIAEIIVTANRREQASSRIGISVTSVSGETLTNLGIADTVAITATVPNLINASIFGPGSNTNFSIRGVAQNDYNDGTESPIATYVDDVYYIPTGAGSFPLFDMERVEVLRGPQGTLFGRNSTGGLIHFITAKPKFETSGSVSASVGSHWERSVTGVVNLPLGKSAALRVAGYYKNNNGYIKNLTGNQPDAGQLETYSGRVQLLLEPTETISSLFKVSYDYASGFSSNIFHEAVGLDPVTGGQYVLGPNEDFYGTGPANDAFGFGPAGGPLTADNGSFRKLKGAESFTLQNTTNFQLSDNISLTSVSAFNQYSRNQTEDCDGTQGRTCATHYINDSEQFTQELRLFGDYGDIRWTAGAYYLHQVGNQNVIVPLYLDVNPIALGVDARLVSDGYAGFLNAEYDFTDKLTLIVGGRISRDQKSINQLNGFYLSNTPNDPFAGYEDDIDFYTLFGTTVAENNYTDATSNGGNHISRTGWTGKIELDYKPDESTLIYGSVSRGQKSLGFNNGLVAVGLSIDDLPFEPETLVAYEVGLKSTFWDRRARLTLASFYYDYSNYQVLNLRGVGSFITNRDAVLYGAEAELNVRPVSGLTLQLSGGLVDSKLRNQANSGGVVEDREMPLAPTWTLSGMARYELDVGDTHKLGIQIDGNARDSFFNTPGNDPAALVPAFVTLNARIDLADWDNAYRIGLSVRNILDEQYISSLFVLQGLGGYRYGFYNPPRWVSLDATINF